ncbi:sporulation protein [Kitasatospora sp. NPDC059673]|uniref:sporulation protein n=1 Tax=Kitasatospora sp. NPDC059673 TaxID=3346901 RepID=UPI0036B9090A
MGLRKLFGFGGEDGQGPEIDTVITTMSPQPGQRIEGEILFRAGGSKLRIDGLYLRVVGKVKQSDGSTADREWAYLSPERAYFEVERRTEQRVGMKGRLPWDCPVTELAGSSTGIDLSLVTTIGDAVRDVDFVHVAASPLHEAVMEAFLTKGYRCTGSVLLDEHVPDIEHRHSWIQTFHLEDPAGDPAGFPTLEVTFFSNPVGAMVYVRRAARHLTWWNDKPPAVPFPVAHHEAGETDLGPRLRDALASLALLDRSAR